MQDFILLIGVETKLQNHHPELKNVRRVPAHLTEISALTPTIRAINRCLITGRLMCPVVFPRKIYVWHACVMIRQSFWDTWLEVDVNRRPHFRSI